MAKISSDRPCCHSCWLLVAHVLVPNAKKIAVTIAARSRMSFRAARYMKTPDNAATIDAAIFSRMSTINQKPGFNGSIG